MKKIISILSCTAAVALLLASCQKKDKKETVLGGSFTSATALSASKSNDTLSVATKTDTAIIFSWLPATFGNPLVITYSLQIDVASDTASGWANSKLIVVGANMLTTTMLGQDLNNAVVSLGFTPGVAGQLVVRVKADVLQSTGLESTIIPAYSNVLSLNITPYSLILYVPNSYQNWNPATAPILNVFPDSSSKYEGYIYLGSSTAGQSFKFTNAPDFLHVNYGDSTGNLLTTNGLAGGMPVSSGGYYQVQANFDAAPGTWNATLVTWSILGDASPGAWTTDTQMGYDSVNDVWTLNNVAMIVGSFKFRANDAWNIDYTVLAANEPVLVGNTVTGALVHSNDGTFQAYDASLGNITIPANGNYNITLDLHVSGSPTYTLTKL